MRVRHVRNGIELPPLMQDERYDFNYQNVLHFREPKTVMPVGWLV